jgi:hypothetical protein
MLNVLKKSDGSRRTFGGGKGSGLEPPKNLPELARDIYETGRSRYDSDSTDSDSSSIAESKTSSQKPSDSTHNVTHDVTHITSTPVSEPNKESVPKLDLSLIKQQFNSQQSTQPSQGLTLHGGALHVPVQEETGLISQSPHLINSQYILQSMSQPSQSELKSTQSSMYQPIQQSFSQENFNMIDDSTGFFKEFENHIKDNGLNNEIIDELLDKNLLDHMVLYHTTKGGDMPFYASSAELSHAIKLKLENLQSIERTWIMNRQKMDLLKKLNTGMEADIHLMSEELKRMMVESRKRGVNVKSSDFFHIVKPKTEEGANIGGIGIGGIGGAIINAEKSHTSFLTPNNTQIHAPVISPHPNLSKYVLSKYVVSDSSKYFYAKNGQVFKSLFDFMSGLESMDIDTFNHHVNEAKNDFANWVKGVFNDLRLSDAIRSLDTREKVWYYLKNNTL